MADLTQTPANVRALPGAITNSGAAKEAISAGDALYRDSSVSPNTFGLAEQAVASTAAEAACVGVAYCNADAGDVVNWVERGPMELGATTAIGQAYCASPNGTPGGIAPMSDLVTTGMHINQLCVGYSTTAVWVQPINTGQTVP